MLANAGYCVYSFNYGMTWLSLGRIGGLGDIAASARTLAHLRRPGAVLDTRPRSTRRPLPGRHDAELLHQVPRRRRRRCAPSIGLSPSNHGTTLSGIVTLGPQLNILGFANACSGAWASGAAAARAGLGFQTNLFGGGDTVAGPRYVVIETTHDLVVTPYTNAFLTGPNVTNILIQDQCPTDPVGHIGIFTDWPALQNVMNQLGPNTPNFRPTCSGYGAFL